MDTHFQNFTKSYLISFLHNVDNYVFQPLCLSILCLADVSILLSCLQNPIDKKPHIRRCCICVIFEKWKCIWLSSIVVLMAFLHWLREMDLSAKMIWNHGIRLAKSLLGCLYQAIKKWNIFLGQIIEI